MSSDQEMVTPQSGTDEKLLHAVEALLFAAHEPLPPSVLESTNGHSGWSLDMVVCEINRRLDAGGHPMRVRQVAGGYQMHLLPEFGPLIDSLLVKTKTQRLTRAGLETLAIIAYRQPCSTPEIEHIRGVACDGVLRTLLERDLVTLKGRSDGPGRPLLYGTTPQFLRYFGLNSLDDLPREEELAELLAARSEERQTEPNVSDAAPKAQGSLTLKHGAEPEAGKPRGFRIRDVMFSGSIAAVI
ncbi:MAG: SMC-Scp complex subunit ScpB [candidate division Zixibacteria bacterium]|nr:SMC-Scp complex subunit ScpB [candidate division Zixibacteria bacterium]